ncbi:3-hydroxyacyl-CoA dehydrogenase NAD-binding domain-containing protein [Mesorhizobium sp. MSK_1335]|uniref:3-hydroxyacyl-CoA dehydrogenase NAD-binding domain-containing protein n=1 Tax=Mesorhizobium montanum TaxID=3072323 RepID=A0ABU4ZUV4_9HYPH|nr:3-hydroxyacyl-CoA dehydrogenase NAD-binding domain-containing protein [Mesorhizobium sp. MSK_1335]MDX8529201.1 3-hydroxyacyl-CoA dehydrogenase NAD-binding domain-containing protein [Mesorhizobium sp. MSK_1335]
MPQTFVTLTIERGVAVLRMNNPPVNALSRDLRQAICGAIEGVAHNDDVAAVVLIGAQGNFIAGADLREFGRPLTDPILPTLLDVIEKCPKPVIAAIDGAALGGGYEVALACDGRVATEKAVVGLPEGTFGIIPGAGGTARLVRLTDAATALEILSTCRHVGAREAKSLGLIDHVVLDLLEESIGFALSFGKRKRRLRDCAPKSFNSDALKLAVQSALRRGRGRPFAAEQVNAIKRAVDAPYDVAAAEARTVFERLRDSEESAALRHLFFAEREAARIDGLADVKPIAVQTIGVVGAGTMGLGITASFLVAGYQVTLTDVNPEVLAVAQERIADFVGGPDRAAALTIAGGLADLAKCDVVLEAVFEDFNTKADLMMRFGQIAKPGAMLASNTSYLDLDKLAAASGRPEAVVGLHFFAPAHKMKLLEIVRGGKTQPEILQTALKLARRLGKVAVVSRVGEGFIGNRIYNSYRAEAEAMLLDGALPWEVDKAIEAFGFAMGPFSVSDLSGLDIAWANRKRKQKTSDDKGLPVLEWLVAAGRLGRKTGAGWYSYQNGAQAPDSVTVSLIEKARSESGSSDRSLSSEEIQVRAVAAIVNEALLVLEDGIAARSADIDLVLINGYGFPRHLGGPLFWAARQPREALVNSLSKVSRGNRTGNLSLIA